MTRNRFMPALLLLAALFTAACSAGAGSAGTLTAVATDDIRNVYLEFAGPDLAGTLPTGVTAAQINAGDATGWQYLLEEDAVPHVELRVYENGTLQDTVTVLSGSAGLSGTVLFGASDTDEGYVWGTDLVDGTGLQSHRYTYKAAERIQPRRLAAGTTALTLGEDIWLAALLYDASGSSKQSDITVLQKDGLADVPLAAVLTVSFTASADA